MATVSLVIVNGAQTLTGTLTISDANCTRMTTAEKTYSGSATFQNTVDYLIRRFLDEMIADTRSIERQALAVADIPIT